MPYKLLLSEQISPAVRRIAIEQLSAANRQLNVDDHMQAGVHEARIYLKKTRALLRLARPIIGKKRFRRWNCEVRDISRAIAHPRDVEALIETVDLLIPAKDFARSRPLLLATKELLLKDKKDAFHDFEVISFNNVTDRLNQAVGEWRTADLPEASFEGLAKGFTDGYRRGRQSLKTAGQLKRRHGGAKVVLTGCGAEVAPERMAAAPAVDFVVGNQDKPGLVALLDDALDRDLAPGMAVTLGPIISQNWQWFQCCEALLKMPFCATAPA